MYRPDGPLPMFNRRVMICRFTQMAPFEMYRGPTRSAGLPLHRAHTHNGGGGVGEDRCAGVKGLVVPAEAPNGPAVRLYSNGGGGGEGVGGGLDWGRPAGL